MTDKPNVIVFFTDQQRWDSTGVHGNPLDLTPNFDRMARAGTHLHTTVTCQPVCGPARSCLQTGMYATNTGSFRNGIPLNPELKTLAHCFAEGGYDTGYIGKWHLAANEHIGAVPEAQRGGYDYWLASNLLEFTSDAYDMVMYDNDQQRVKLPGYRVDAQTDAVIRYIDSHQENPFFLFISYIEPHHQNHLDDYPPPDGYRERYAGRWTPPDLAALGGSSQQHLGGYWGMIARLDEALGRMIDSLKSLGMLENTVILYTTDHGCHFKTRNNEYKRSCHEASVRLPTAITGPGFTGGGEIREMISLVDLSPTLLDAAGLPIPEQMEGRSVLPLVNRQAVDWPEEAFIQISESQVGRAVRTKRWKYGVTAPDKHGGRDAGSDEYVEQYLYDLAYDPYELTNLIGWESHRQASDVLKARLIRRMVQAGEAAPVVHNAPVIPKGQRKVSEAEAEA
ncbi:MAG: sulfatase-like hydrolase/transferase [Caldilineaceae bacterium]|nr:sulfatase-like hydrolase/transferase [Caldilineaceae bacterium]